MSDRQEQELQVRLQGSDFDSDTLNLLSMLHLKSSATVAATNHQPFPATHSPLPSIANCSKKRRSPSSSSSSRSKKLRARRTALFPPAAAASPNPAPLSPLQRTFSEPINVAESANAPDSRKSQLFSSLAAASSQLLKNLSPENSKNYGSLPKSSSPAANPSLPPLPPPLRRASSDPIPSNFLPSAANTPPRQSVSPSRTFSRSPSCDQESPNSMRLKKIKEKMLEMSEWCEEIVREEDYEDDTASEDHSRKMSVEIENERGEAVTVDEINGGLVLHFKCTCGKGYEVLLSGDTCYYKLM